MGNIIDNLNFRGFICLVERHMSNTANENCNIPFRFNTKYFSTQQSISSDLLRHQGTLSNGSNVAEQWQLKCKELQFLIKDSVAKGAVHKWHQASKEMGTEGYFSQNHAKINSQNALKI